MCEQCENFESRLRILPWQGQRWIYVKLVMWMSREFVDKSKAPLAFIGNGQNFSMQCIHSAGIQEDLNIYILIFMKNRQKTELISLPHKFTF